MHFSKLIEIQVFGSSVLSLCFVYTKEEGRFAQRIHRCILSCFNSSFVVYRYTLSVAWRNIYTIFYACETCTVQSITFVIQPFFVDYVYR